MKSWAVTFSTFLYSRMLPWYPPALRAEFGEDMVDIFAESIETAWRSASWRGVAAAWRAVSRDLIDIVLPYRTARAAPVLLAIIASTLLYASLLAAIDPSRHHHKSTTALAARACLP
jgi:hypothetical protein